MENKNRKLLPIVVRYGVNLLLPFAFVFGGYVVLHGDSSPGGGFQGGVVLAGAVLLVFLGYGFKRVKTAFNEHFLHNSETVAELIYVFTGVAGIFMGGYFAYNQIIAANPSLETTLIMNDAVGYHVMGGISVLLIVMLALLGPAEEEEIAPAAAESAEEAEAPAEEAVEAPAAEAAEENKEEEAEQA